MDNHIYKYIFASEKYEIKKDSQNIYKFKIKLNDEILWLTIGVCDKKKLKKIILFLLLQKKMVKKEIMEVIS